MTNQMKTMMHGQDAVAMDAATQGARRATGGATSIAPPDPEVAATAKRRQFSSSQKRRILTEADRSTAPGEIGALLRREGIYSSQLATWRKQRAAAERAALAPQKRGPKADPAIAETRRLDQLARENDRLRHQLAQARTIIDVQKKVCTLLGLLTDETPDGTS
jgi:transposase